MIDPQPARIIVLTDAPGREFGNDLAAELSVAGYRVRSVDRTTFPIADSLPATLLGLASQCDRLVVVISDSPIATRSVAREARCGR